MFKKVSLILVTALIFAFPITAHAFEIYEMEGPALIDLFYDPSEDVYILYFSPDLVTYIEYGSYRDETFDEVISFKTVGLGPGERFVGIHYFTCNSYYQAEYFNSSGDRVGFLQFHATELVNPRCSSSAGSIGTEPGDPGDGSGGGDGGGDDGGGDDGGSGGEEEEEEDCFCGCIFETEAWEDLQDTLDDILDAIPPPPDWDEVADTFYERIVPRMVDDFERMLAGLLGSAPNPPSPPAKPTLTNIPEPQKPAQISDRGIQNRQPSFSEPSGLRDASFTKSEIEQAAPTIQERQDPTGGFSIVNPLDTLPEGPDTYPIPGQTDAGEWDHQPAQEPIPYPDPPVDQPTAPTDPPLPDEDETDPPLPGDDDLEAPIPGGGESIPDPRYKTHPDNPDGV